MADLERITGFLDSYLRVAEISDYGYNGLQVEGRREIRKAVTGVTACVDLLEKAAAAGADLVLVHHGLYWKGGDPRITGILAKRIRALGGMSLAAYHLPLDLHPEIGNNALILRAVGAAAAGGPRPGDPAGVAVTGRFAAPQDAAALAAKLRAFCGRDVQVLGDPSRKISTVAVCSGAGGFVLEDPGLTADALITGEVREQHYHLAVEKGVVTFVCGHHATETCGIRALGELVAREFGVACEFINSYCPL